MDFDNTSDGAQDVAGHVAAESGQSGSPAAGQAPAAPKIRVAIVDDHPLIAEGLRQIFADEIEFEIVGMASSVNEALNLVDEQSPNVVLMDYELGDGNGIDAAGLILRHRPRTKIIILSGNKEPEVIAHAVDSGCVGFLSKYRPWNEIVNAVHAAYRGEVVLQASELLGVVAQNKSEEDSQTINEKEMSVLRLLMNLRSTDWIATELRLPTDEVLIHEKSILTKLRARTIREAIDTAKQIGIVPFSRFS